MKTFDITTIDELHRVAKRVAQHIKPGDVLALYGDLGSGKTTFTTALSAELGVTSAVTSPTFTIIQRYVWKPVSSIYHLDLYRLKQSKDLETLGIVELLETTKDVLIIEWPELIEHLLPANTLFLQFRQENNMRELTISEPAENSPNISVKTPNEALPSLTTMENCLYIDSSYNKQLKLRFNQLKQTIEYENPRSQDTLKQITEFLAEHAQTLQDIKSIQVTQGPGNFTSLRTGIATAQALAFALQIPINNLPAGSTITAEYGKPPTITKPKHA